MENVVIFQDHLEYFVAIWHNVCMAVCGHLVYFSLFGMFGPRKIWQPWSWTKRVRRNGKFPENKFFRG
jgi:hypothetical protein